MCGFKGHLSKGLGCRVFLLTTFLCPSVTLSIHFLCLLSSSALRVSFYPHHSSRCDRVTCEFTQNPSSCFSLPLRISFYNISFPDNTPVPADIFRMGPSNSVMGDVVALRIVSGDMDGYFGVRQHAHGGEVSLRRPLFRPRDFFLSVEMTLTRYGTTHLYMAKIAVFVAHAHSIWPSRIVAFSRPDM